jgi:RNA polymerase sigma factor (sigma-70 family)
VTRFCASLGTMALWLPAGRPRDASPGGPDGALWARVGGRSGYDGRRLTSDESQGSLAQGPRGGPAALPGLEATLDLIARAKSGEQEALEALFARCIPPLRRWARGRLPTYARDLAETADLVQDTVYRALQRLGDFDARHEGALQAYLRQAVLNRIRDEVRRAVRRPVAVGLEDRYADPSASPLERAIGRQGVERYEAALQRLAPAHREAIIARLELQHSYEEIAVAFGKPNPNAARSVVVRALARLVEEMRDAR